MESWYEKFQPYWKEGTLAQADGDTGDSSQRVGTFWVLMTILGIEMKPMYELSIKAHEIVGGRYRRSPISSFWGFDPTNFSRDQHSILNLAFASVGDKKRLLESYKQIALRAGFHQNFLRGTDDPEKRWKFPDFCTPNQLAVFVRGMDCWILYPFLLIIDLFFFPDFVFRKLNKWDSDNMLAQQIMFASWKMPTPWSRLVFHLYDRTDFRGRLFLYHGKGNGIKPLHDLFVSAYDALRRQYEKNYFDRGIVWLIGLCYKNAGEKLRQDRVG